VTLPPLVERYVERALPVGAGEAGSVDITQEGTIWMKPGTRGMGFTAKEHFEVERVAFTWRARFPVIGPLALRVVDAYDRDRGVLELRLFGARVQRQRGLEVSEGEAMRYLAELPWVPQAIVRNEELHWRQLDEASVEVSTPVAGQRVAVTFGFDDLADITTVSALRRRQVGKSWEETRWGGEFGDYTFMGGMRLPAAAEVYWELDGDRFVYWRGRVNSVSAR
jgi:hypothetical protein